MNLRISAWHSNQVNIDVTKPEYGICCACRNSRGLKLFCSLPVSGISPGITWASFMLLCFFMSTSWASWILWIIRWQHPSTLILYWQKCAWVFSRIKQFSTSTATKMCLAAVKSTQGRTAETAWQVKVEEARDCFKQVPADKPSHLLKTRKGYQGAIFRLMKRFKCVSQSGS